MQPNYPIGDQGGKGEGGHVDQKGNEVLYDLWLPGEAKHHLQAKPGRVNADVGSGGEANELAAARIVYRSQRCRCADDGSQHRPGKRRAFQLKLYRWLCQQRHAGAGHKDEYCTHQQRSQCLAQELSLAQAGSQGYTQHVMVVREEQQPSDDQRQVILYHPIRK